MIADKLLQADAAFNENVGSQFNIPTLIKEKRHGAPSKTILNNSNGCVKPGEMLLVLGMLNLYGYQVALLTSSRTTRCWVYLTSENTCQQT